MLLHSLVLHGSAPRSATGVWAGDGRGDCRGSPDGPREGIEFWRRRRSGGPHIFRQGGEKRNELCDSGRLASAHLESRGGRRQVSLWLVTMAETIQKEMSCFPRETGSSRIFDDKTVHGLDKRRRSKQKGLDTKGGSSSPGPTYPPKSHDQPNTPNATNLFPPKDLSGCARSSKATRTTRKPGRMGRRIASPSPHQPVSCNSISPFALSPSGTMQIAPVAVPRATISVPRLRLRASTPTQIIPDTVDSTSSWQTQVISPSHAQQEALCPPRR